MTTSVSANVIRTLFFLFLIKTRFNFKIILFFKLNHIYLLRHIYKMNNQDKSDKKHGRYFFSIYLSKRDNFYFI